MTPFALEARHLVAAVLAGLLLLVVIGFIVGVCICALVLPRIVGNRQRLRMPKNRVPRRTRILTPDHKDPRIVGDVPYFPQARYPGSRANMRGGKA